MIRIRLFTAALCAALGTVAGPAWAQQRPLVTEDPETIGAGRMLIETGLDVEKGVFIPLSGLSGDLFTVPTVGLSFGLSSIAELQFDGGLYQRMIITDREAAPFSPILDITGNKTHAVRDMVIGTKVRVLSETAGRPALALRFATRLPNASNESGLGRDTTDFWSTVIVGKTIESVRVVGNAGLLIFGDPTKAARQEDLLTYGLSIARAVGGGAEVVAEINGQANFESGTPTPGGEDKAVARVGGRLTRGPVRFDVAALIGLTRRDPNLGLTAGLTWVFNAFKVP
jgi:hypothetical protein